MSHNILLISIKPKYANQILNGKKTVELRRVRTKLKTGDFVLVYVTSPQKALVGYFEVQQVIIFENFQDDHKKFWQEVKNYACLEYSEFKEYYQEASIGVGIFIRNFKLFDSSIKLHTLKEKLPNFHPPQSYHYLNSEKTNIVEKIVGCKLQ